MQIKTLLILKNFVKEQHALLLIMLAPTVIFIFTLGKYYGFYYDNHPLNIVALELTEKFRLYFYHTGYTIHSTFYAYLLYPLFKILGATDFSVQFFSAFFHLLTIGVCYKIGKRFYSRSFGLLFASLLCLAPLYFIDIYTWSENSFIYFLNILSIYYFLCGLQEISKLKIALSSLLYSLSCFQQIYSIPLILFFAIFSIAAGFIYKNRPILASGPVISRPAIFLQATKILNYIFCGMALIAFLYLVVLLRAIFAINKIAYFASVLIFIIISGSVFLKLPKHIKEMLKFCSLFIFIFITVLLLLDLFVQLDIHLFGQRFGTYRDDVPIGGFGKMRPPFIFNNKEIAVFGKTIYASVLSSLLLPVFHSSYSGISLSLPEISGAIVSYYKTCFPVTINAFMGVGIIGLLFEMFYRKAKGYLLTLKYLFPLIWLLAITASFVNRIGFHMFRTHIMPQPYFFAALGVYYCSQISGNIFAKFKNPRKITAITAVCLVLFISLKQSEFLAQNIFHKYKHDKSNNNYYKLFTGWSYGRGYKEVGEFLLKDAPLKKGGNFRSIFVYTVSPYTSAGNCLLFFNSMEWYTKNKVGIIYDWIWGSYKKYGSSLALRQYLYDLFNDYPDVETVYFADFYDLKDNFSFFSKIHRDILPYKVVNDDDTLDYDCILYKFERDKWRQQLNEDAG